MRASTQRAVTFSQHHEQLNVQYMNSVKRRKEIEDDKESKKTDDGGGGNDDNKKKKSQHV